VPATANGASPDITLTLSDEKEPEMRLKHAKLIGVVLLATLGASVAVAAAAQAETAPSFTVGGTRLVAGKTHNGSARATKAFVITNVLGSATIECSGLGTEESVALGSNPGNPGTDGGIAVFSGCKNGAGSNGSKCHLAPSEGSAETTTVIKTEPLKGVQVENVVNGTKGNQLLGELVPANGGVFVTLFFGGECTSLAAKVSGQAVGEVLLDNGTSEPTGKIELGQTPKESGSWVLLFPADPITQVWLIANGIGKISKTDVTALGEKSIITGTTLGLLASTHFAPEPNALWSPLP
jgi:hypothetical protein